MNNVVNPVFLRSPNLSGTGVEAMRQTLRAYFHATFSKYEQLFELLACDEAFYHKPISLRHPLIFYFGHTATFFINKLVIAGLLHHRINPTYESMFAIGVDEMSWDDLDESNYAWPTVAAVREYRHKVRAAVDALIMQAPLSLPIAWDHPWWAIVMGIEHERIHLETSSVLLRQQRLEWVRPHPAWPVCQLTGEPPGDERVEIPSGMVLQGKRRDDAYYGWDNEYGEHEAEVSTFAAGKFLVCNAWFNEFVQAGGYQNNAWWDEEGEAWRQFSGGNHPAFWVQHPDGWRLRVLAELIPMPWDWPAEVNYHEAKAWCNWRAATTGDPIRLPTEDEWQRLYQMADIEESLTAAPAAANLQFDHWASPCPVTHHMHGELCDVVGNVWQWTETPIYPLTGFEVHPYYDDFTVPTFDGYHNLIKGGSWASSGNEVRPSARYAFRRHFFQHAGFRYVVSETLPEKPNLYYESDAQLSEYAEFHFGDEYFGVANFPQTIARIALNAMTAKATRRALDLGCAVGRTSFELARGVDHVVGVDFSARFINLAIALAHHGSMRYSLVDEGELHSYYQRELTQLGLDDVRHKVEFLQGDACNLKATIQGFDLIVAANLIDRLYNPAQFLREVHTRLNPQGILLIASPYTWLEHHTPRAEWLGGFKRDGENVTGLDGLKTELSTHFTLLGTPIDVPFVIRETRRKFQHSVSQVTVWQRNSDD